VHRTTAGELKSITLTETPTGKYFAVCLFEDCEDAPGLPVVFPTEAVIGVDVGPPTSPSRAPAGRQTTPAMLPAPSETCGASRNPSFANRKDRTTGLKPDALSHRRMTPLPTAEAMSSTSWLDDWLTKTKPTPRH
jgi:hypothetical protein